MNPSVGDMFAHKVSGDIYLVIDLKSMSPEIHCLNLDKGETCWMPIHLWRPFYQPITNWRLQ